MLNPDGKYIKLKLVFKIILFFIFNKGVRYGNYRCCILGHDFNRKWKDPSPI